MINSWTEVTADMKAIGEMAGDGEEGVGAVHLLQRTIGQVVGAEAIVEDVEVAFRRLGLVTESHGQEILEIFQTQARTRGPMHTPQEWEYRVTAEAANQQQRRLTFPVFSVAVKDAVAGFRPSAAGANKNPHVYRHVLCQCSRGCFCVLIFVV